MGPTTAERKEALAAAAEQELEGLRARGVNMTGNAFSPILLVKGVLSEGERAGGVLLAGADGEALRAALSAIGWAPQDFCALAAVTLRGDGHGEGGAAGGLSAGGVPDGDGVPRAASPLPLSPELFREAVEALDPEAVVLLDDVAADAMREAYADGLAIIEDFNTAMLQPGLVASVIGRRVLALDGFEAALPAPAEKQRMWAYLKQLPPLGAPY